MTWRWFKVVWAGRWHLVAWLLVGSTLTAVLLAGFAWTWKSVVEAAEAGNVTGAAIRALTVGVGQALLYITVQGVRNNANEYIQRVARLRVLAAVARSAPGTLDRFRMGDLLTRLTDDVSTEKLAWFLCSGVFRGFEALAVIVACVIGMLRLDPALTVWSMAPLPLLVVSHLWNGRELGRRADRTQRAVSRVGAVVQDVFGGIRVVQARGLGALARRAFADAAVEQSAAEVHAARLFQYQMVQFGYGWQVALAVLLFAGGSRVMDGALSAGDFLAFTGFVLTLVFPMFDLGAFVVRWRQAATSLERLEEVMAAAVPDDAPVEEEDLTVPARLTTPWMTLELGEPLVLRPGELLAVTGPVGCGKSTLLAALAGQVPLVGARPVGPAVAWAPQAPVLLEATLAENIGLGAKVPPEIAEQAQLTPDLARWPEGLGTLVGERGVTLSGGQQQRVQLARALASGAPLLLFDDATAALDADTEARFWDGLDRRGRIVVVVTHRPATLARADRVLYLRDGRVTAAGTHAALCEFPAYAAAYGAR